MSEWLRRFSRWLLAVAERIDHQARTRAAEGPWHDANAHRRVFELRTRIHAGYY